MKNIIALATTAAALAIAAPANAVLLQYTLTGLDGTGKSETASFQLSSTQVPDFSSAGNGFVFYDVPGAYAYGATTATVEDIIFYNSSLDGGFFTGDYLITTAGPQLYTGTEAAPVLSTGTFQLTDYFTGGNLTLVVTPVAAAVPEPAAWTMMIAGFGLIGTAMRRRTTTVTFA